MRFTSMIILFMFISSAYAEQTLRLYNWEDYMPQSVLEEFTQETGINVELVYYETDELKDEIVLSTTEHGLDLVIGSDYSFIKYLKKGDILAPIPSELFPNKQYLDPQWHAKSPSLAQYTAPFAWGSLGIIYRSDLAETDFTSWRDLLEPSSTLSGKIIMLDDMRDAMSSALLAMGESVNTQAPNVIKAAAKLLKTQRPHVNAYRYISLTESSELVSGDIFAALGYSGDALILQDIHPNIRFSVPNEGTSLWSDHIAVFASSQNKAAAFQFINFINAPHRAAFIAEELGSATTNIGALPYLSEAHKTNTTIYPPTAVIAKSDFYEQLPARIQRLYTMSFLHAKQ